MKKALSLIIAVFLLLSVAGCDSNSQKYEEHQSHDYILWDPANCQSPKTCQLCGYQEGDLGDHVWNTEICGATATCEICGLEGINTQEHSVQIGYCEYCNQFQNKELYDTLLAELTVVYDKMEVICDLVEEVYSDSNSSEIHYLAAIESLHPRFTECKETVEHLIELCGEYEQLAMMKETLEEALAQYIENPVATYDGFGDYFVCTGRFSYKVEMAFLNLP